MTIKTYFIRSLGEVDYDDDTEEEFEIVEAERLGQYYNGGYPNYAWALRTISSKHSYKEASAFIEALIYSSGYGPDRLKHPTFTGSGAVDMKGNLIGKYSLDPEGGDLLFTIVSD